MKIIFRGLLLTVLISSVASSAYAAPISDQHDLRQIRPSIRTDNYRRTPPVILITTTYGVISNVPGHGYGFTWKVIDQNYHLAKVYLVGGPQNLRKGIYLGVAYDSNPEHYVELEGYEAINFGTPVPGLTPGSGYDLKLVGANGQSYSMKLNITVTNADIPEKG